jgi:hypothetical protein
MTFANSLVLLLAFVGHWVADCVCVPHSLHLWSKRSLPLVILRSLLYSAVLFCFCIGITFWSLPGFFLARLIILLSWAYAQEVLLARQQLYLYRVLANLEQLLCLLVVLIFFWLS